MRLAREKAEAVWALHTDLPVLAADTTVVIDDEILGKPESEAEAHAMLGKLSGRDHMVHTAVALWSDEHQMLFHTSTQVCFAPLTTEEIHAYWESGEPRGKAGAYAIQGLGAVFVTGISGTLYRRDGPAAVRDGTPARDRQAFLCGVVVCPRRSGGRSDDGNSHQCGAA